MSTNAAKLDFSNFSNLEEITSQRYLPQEGNKQWKFGYLPLKTSLTTKKKFYVQNRSLPPELTSSVSFSNFQRNLFHFQYFGRLDEKRAAATRLVD